MDQHLLKNISKSKQRRRIKIKSKYENGLRRRKAKGSQSLTGMILNKWIIWRSEISRNIERNVERSKESSERRRACQLVCRFSLLQQGRLRRLGRLKPKLLLRWVTRGKSWQWETTKRWWKMEMPRALWTFSTALSSHMLTKSSPLMTTRNCKKRSPPSRIWARRNS